VGKHNKLTANQILWIKHWIEHNIRYYTNRPPVALNSKLPMWLNVVM
jgi:hypothetical protein